MPSPTNVLPGAERPFAIQNHGKVGVYWPPNAAAPMFEVRGWLRPKDLDDVIATLMAARAETMARRLGE